ncbi:MAG TPA: hypothetical protein VEL11_01815 [Candidatus Bathyarchaeia archaeon]|nr:hypothetical protein [Candidatus Bathyarchaeia archaeon]
MHKHASFAVMAAILLPAIITLTLYTVSRANAQGNETSAAGGELHNVTNAAGGELHNVTNAAGGELHNMTNATTRTHVEVPPGN